MWEVERILDECEEKPQVLLMENVPMLFSKKHIKNFQLWRSKLESIGYVNFAETLNSKEIGYPEPIPQNRNRAFMVSILGNYYYEFPKKTKLNKRLKDLLEDKVDEKYYVSDKAIKYITKPERIEKKYTQLNGDIGIPLTAKGQNNWTGDFVLDSERERESGQQSRPQRRQRIV